MIDQRVSETIRNVRFPLIVLIVFIHCQFTSITIGGKVINFSIEEFPLYCNISYFISKYICAIGVPLFGLLSGFLYFYKVEDFTKEKYIEKTKRRIRSLVIPYLLWNILVFLFYFVAQSLMPSMGGDRLLIKDYTWVDYLNVFWGIDDGCPMCFQFWFLRDLIIVSLISPVIYLLVRKLSPLLLVLIALWFFDIKIPIPGLDSSVITFFSVGAFLSVKKITEKDIQKNLFTILWVVYLLLIAVEVILFNNGLVDSTYFRIIYKIGVLVGVVVFPLFFYFFYNKITKSFLEKGSFFVYAAHGILVSVLTRLLLSFVAINNDLVALGIYFMIPFLSISICLIVYYILKKYTPSIASVLTGGKV